MLDDSVKAACLEVGLDPFPLVPVEAVLKGVGRDDNARRQRREPTVVLALL
jgi:hypothetical protein